MLFADMAKMVKPIQKIQNLVNIILKVKPSLNVICRHGQDGKTYPKDSKLC
ncbi:hypothetical protein HanIR_Chr09g0416011 [Helianthus annuus]|nr:hypothetical protein HanIR_Chr09g0416011 [Helianthus annuus]